MSQVTEILSRIGIFIILAFKSCLEHVGGCLKSCVGVFYKAKSWENPERNF